MAAQSRHSMPPLKQQYWDRFLTYVSAVSNTTGAFLMELNLTRYTACFFCTTISWGQSPLTLLHGQMVWGAMCGDGSPYSTVHQVIPGGHVEETVQGELMREQLDNRITQVRINSVLGWVIPTASGVEKKRKGRASVEFTLLIVSWSTRADLSQRTKAFTSGLEFVCEANPPSVMHRDHNRSDGHRACRVSPCRR